MQEKECSLCKSLKPVDLFPKCKGGRFGVRGNCKDCESKRQKVYRQNNPEKIKTLWKSWYEDNSSYNQERWQAYYQSNDERLKEGAKLHKKLNPHRYAHYNAKRRSAKLKATPTWLTSSQLKEIEDLYWLSQDLQRVTGFTYHVDHIVPLQGRGVCGLHVPWNLQVLPSDINLQKGNSLAAEAEAPHSTCSYKTR